ncbi:MAG: ABC transporter permease [Lachnospiraceae bacterium]|nr:ABC transporter permease [Lachnospiraceae bacterium]
MNNIKKIIKNDTFQSVLWICALLALWEIAPRCGWVSSYLLPPFSKVVSTLWEQLRTNNLALMTWNSLQLVLIGTLVSMAIAIVAAFLCMWCKPIENLFKALCTIFNPLPGMAIMPLILMWFGLSTGSMIALMAHGVVWPLVTELLAGFRSVPKIYREYAKNIGVDVATETRTILLIAIMPYFLSGLRIGWGRAWRALISAEMVFGIVGSLGGIGYYIFIQRAYGNLTKVMAGVLVIVIIGILIEQIFRQIEKHTIEKWGMTND